MPAREGRLIISSSAAIDLHNISISSKPRCSLPLTNKPKTSVGLALQTTAADICKASAEERESTNVPAQWESRESVSHSLRCCSSSVSLLSLSRRPFSWLRLKVLQHTWFIAGDSGGVAGGLQGRRRSRCAEPAKSGGLTAALHPDRRLTAHYCCKAISAAAISSPVSAALSLVCVNV